MLHKTRISLLMVCGNAHLVVQLIFVFMEQRRCKWVGKMSENSELKDRGVVCILSDRRRASKGDVEEERSWGRGLD